MKQVGLEQTRGQGGPQDALKAFQVTSGAVGGVGDAIAIIYMPERACFARLEEGELRDGDGKVVDLQRAFEFRLFNEGAELRWRRRGNTGEYVLLQEGEGGKPHWRRDTQYLLWGERDVKQPDNTGWLGLSSSQVGGIEVPLEANGNVRRVVLRACEYFTTFEDGNIGFATERLLGLAPAGPIHCRGEAK